MLNLKIGEKNYEVSNCYNSVNWNGVEKLEFVSVNVVDSSIKDEISSYVGTRIIGEILNGAEVIVSIDTTYVVREIFMTIPTVSGFTLRFEKNISTQ